MTPHLFHCKNVTEGNMIPKQKWSHMTWEILSKTFIWPQIATCVTSAHNWPSTNFLTMWPVTAACGKIAHTVFPNQLGPNLITMGINATYDLISPFTVPLFNINGSRSNMRMHFKMCPKIMTPHLFDCKNVTEGNGTQTKMVSYDLGILGKTLIWPHIVTCVTSAHNWPLTNFFPLWLNITKLLIQCPLMSWTKFHYHGHQCHLWPHFTIHSSIVQYEWK